MTRRPLPRRAPAGLRILAVDDEPPALDELSYLLRADPRVEAVITAPDAHEALRALRTTDIDAAFLDIRIPGPDGLELATMLQRSATPPAVVFVTAYDDRAADAFDLGVLDYIRKPVEPERLAESLRRIVSALGITNNWPESAMIPVDLAGGIRLLPRSAVHWVEAQGDYARLHTATGSHLVRMSLATLAERWADAGFARIHRSYLVRLDKISELRLTSTGYVVIVDGAILPVARRHTRELKDLLLRAARPDRRG